MLPILTITTNIFSGYNEYSKVPLAHAYSRPFRTLIPFESSYKPGSPWVSNHWVALNENRDDFTREDLYTFEKLSPLFSKRKVDTIVDETIEHVSKWSKLAVENGVPEILTQVVTSNLRLGL